MTEIRVFYAYQSDRPYSTGKDFIKRAIEKAKLKINHQTGMNIKIIVLEEEIQGSDHIILEIEKLIPTSHLMIADITSVGETTNKRDKLVSNSNVCLEAGYAAGCYKSIFQCGSGFPNVIMVANTEYAVPEKMPFDFKSRDVLTYALAPQSDDQAIPDHHPQLTYLSDKLFKKMWKIISANIAHNQTSVIPLKPEDIYGLDGSWEFQVQEIEGVNTSESIKPYNIKFPYPAYVYFAAQLQQRSSKSLDIIDLFNVLRIQGTTQSILEPFGQPPGLRNYVKDIGDALLIINQPKYYSKSPRLTLVHDDGSILGIDGSFFRQEPPSFNSLKGLLIRYCEQYLKFLVKYLKIKGIIKLTLGTKGVGQGARVQIHDKFGRPHVGGGGKFISTSDILHTISIDLLEFEKEIFQQKFDEIKQKIIRPFYEKILRFNGLTELINHPDYPIF